MNGNQESVFDLLDTMDDERPVTDPADLPPPVPPAGDTADSWSRIVGNGEFVRVMKAFVGYAPPRRHILVYGPNRSGKTYTVHTAMKAKFCRFRLPNLDPYNRCKSCRTWEAGGWERLATYVNKEGQTYRYQMIDGTNPTTFAEDVVCGYRNRGCPLVVYIDEVSHPEFVKFMPRLVKPMTETPMTIVASGVRLRPRKEPVTGARYPGLSQDFRYRFAATVKTTAPAIPDFHRWLSDEVRQRGVEADEDAVALIVEGAGNIPGQALRPVMKAELMRVRLTREFVEEYRWEV